MRILFLIATWLCLAAAPAGAGEPEAGEGPALISGRAVALDGDTLLVFGVGRVRLFGIDAPEMRSPGGAWSRAELDDLIAGAEVASEVLDKDRRERPVANCGTAAEADLGSALIARGHALAYRLFTHGDKAPAETTALYDRLERAAREAGVGLWAREGAAAAAGAAWWRDTICRAI